MTGPTGDHDTAPAPQLENGPPSMARRAVDKAGRGAACWGDPTRKAPAMAFLPVTFRPVPSVPAWRAG